MISINLFSHQAHMDLNATKAWYAQSSGWNCDCGHCRNFIRLATQRKLPAPILDVLDELGIPAEKATYVCEILPEKEGFLYQFSYRICGTFHGEVSSILQSWGEIRCCHEPYPYGAPDFPTPHFDLEFWVTLPCILDELR